MKLLPESNRLIILKCDDFMGDYTTEGMFIDYKAPIKKGKNIFTSRFCMYDEKTKTWESAHDEFRHCNSWEYK